MATRVGEGRRGLNPLSAPFVPRPAAGSPSSSATTDPTTTSPGGSSSTGSNSGTAETGGRKDPLRRPSAVSSSDEEAPLCVCNRPRGLVLCRRCGFQEEGRVRMPCPRHRNRHALMDLQLCPTCRAYTLKEIPL